VACNGVLEEVDEREVRDALPAGIRGRYAAIARCGSCGRLYWPGSHYERLSRIVKRVAAR
jgi:hypothetical protein